MSSRQKVAFDSENGTLEIVKGVLLPYFEEKRMVAECDCWFSATRDNKHQVSLHNIGGKILGSCQLVAVVRVEN